MTKCNVAGSLRYWRTNWLTTLHRSKRIAQVMGLARCIEEIGRSWVVHGRCPRWVLHVFYPKHSCSLGRRKRYEHFDLSGTRLLSSVDRRDETARARRTETAIDLRFRRRYRTERGRNPVRPKACHEGKPPPGEISTARFRNP